MDNDEQIVGIDGKYYCVWCETFGCHGYTWQQERCDELRKNYESNKLKKVIKHG